MTRDEGVILKALSGFYYVQCGGDLVTCRGRGKLRHQKSPPWWETGWSSPASRTGPVPWTEVLPRRNAFQRPAVANIDQLVIIASGPFRERPLPAGPDHLPWRRVRVPAHPVHQQMGSGPGPGSAGPLPGAGIPPCGERPDRPGAGGAPGMLAGKLSAFTGNSGVGKSSILNALDPTFALATGEISEKLGRGGTPPAMWSSSRWRGPHRRHPRLLRL